MHHEAESNLWVRRVFDFLQVHAIQVQHFEVFFSAFNMVAKISLVLVVEDESGVEGEVALVEASLVAKLLEDATMVQRAL